MVSVAIKATISGYAFAGAVCSGNGDKEKARGVGDCTGGLVDLWRGGLWWNSGGCRGCGETGRCVTRNAVVIAVMGRSMVAAMLVKGDGNGTEWGDPVPGTC